MQHGDAAVELGLHIGIAGGREGHLAELLVLLAGCAACERCGDQASGKQNSPRLRLHRKSPLWLASDGLRACSINGIRLRVRSTLMTAKQTGHSLEVTAHRRRWPPAPLGACDLNSRRYDRSQRCIERPPIVREKSV